MTNTTQLENDRTTSVRGADEAANVAVVRRFVAEVINAGRHETVHDVIHPGYRYHGPDGEVTEGREGAWQIVAGFRASFSDLHAEITSEIAQDDRVALTLVLTGTHDGELMEIAPTGASIELPMAVVSRLEDQWIVEEWEYYDTAALISQLSAVPTPGARDIEGGSDVDA